ncbi:hypothetical protein B296_00015593 [Ensete ventricosum]|uniref:Uncharacterized protein n=1 Tax=Ensete ventricosum TaxID=4639 RepID=A0A427B1A1_ENSVE|nr:hypothetical protein B296_00015593 [Ensete ventricosum]
MIERRGNAPERHVRVDIKNVLDLGPTPDEIIGAPVSHRFYRSEGGDLIIIGNHIHRFPRPTHRSLRRYRFKSPLMPSPLSSLHDLSLLVSPLPSHSASSIRAASQSAIGLRS